MRKAIIFFGAPGAGKGTQANLIAKQFQMTHFDTGRYLEYLIYAPENKGNKIIQKECLLRESGHLMTPSWVFNVTKTRIKQISMAGLGLVLSGSPRTVHETELLIPLLEELYGRENMMFFLITVPPKETIRRNAGRLLCSVCGIQLMAKKGKNFKKCPFCGGDLRRRKDDSPLIIKKRIVEYAKRTEPIFEEIKKRKYSIIEIDGTPLPGDVFKNIILHIEKGYVQQKRKQKE
ncbi:MAG: nucleoside monophosphate kinase [bacterium]